MSIKKTKASAKKAQKNVKVKMKKIVQKKVAKKTAQKVKKIVKKSRPISRVATKPTSKAISKAKNKAKSPKNKVIKTKKILAKLPKKIIAKKPEKPLKKITKVENKIEKKPVEIATAKAPIKTGKTFNFKVGDHAVYPSHGIGKIIEIEDTLVLGENFSCYLMLFEKEKLTIKVPVKNSEKIGLRPLVSKVQMEEIFTILRGGIKKMKGMWSRRAQEYESKINSGNIILLAEVLRDLTRDIEDGERSYSERIIYETAISRLAAEYAAIYKTDFEDAKSKVMVTAKDKLNSDEKATTDDDFDYAEKIKSGDDDAEEEVEEEEDEDAEEEEEDDDDDDDDDDDKPRKKRKK